MRPKRVSYTSFSLNSALSGLGRMAEQWIDTIKPLLTHSQVSVLFSHYATLWPIRHIRAGCLIVTLVESMAF